MKYVLKQNWYTTDRGGSSVVPSDFWVVDERGRQVYRVEGRALAFGKNITFYDGRDSELAYISQKLPSRGPTFEIYHGDDLQAIMPRTVVSPMGCRFSVEGRAPDDLHAEGNLTEREYTFSREGKVVGRVSKDWFRTPATYGVFVSAGEDDLLLLAGSMIIDLCCHCCNGLPARSVRKPAAPIAPAAAAAAMVRRLSPKVAFSR
jgi:uncharacterized protein YxjI